MEKNKFLSLIANISETAKNDNWQAQYDSDLDCFYWTKIKISKNSTLKQFLDDFSLYINNKGAIEGLVIEYAKYNFLGHHKEFEPLFGAMTEKIDNAVYIVPKNKEDKIQHYLENIADKVAKETLDAISSNKLSKNSLLAAARG